MGGTKLTEAEAAREFEVELLDLIHDHPDVPVEAMVNLLERETKRLRATHELAVVLRREGSDGG